MLIRYGKDKKGKTVAIANIYMAQEHNISPKSLDARALRIIQRLQRSGFDAYVVGGAVRDLLLQQEPKDFDIVTNARPEQVRRLFRNSRIIGKRFKLVHVYFGSTNIEVATFRSKHAGNHVNEYGTIEEDAQRRDFSINALYYDPIKHQVLDFVDGFADFNQKQIRSVIPLHVSFREDPVRMLRGVKYSVTTGFTLPKKEAKHIKSQARLLKGISSSRMTEELMKILASPRVVDIFNAMLSYGLLQYLMPNMVHYFRKTDQSIQQSLHILSQQKEPARWRMGYYLVRKAVTVPEGAEPKLYEEVQREVYKAIKGLITPLTPPNIDVERATVQILKDAGYQKRPRAKRRHKAKARAVTT